MNETKSHHLPMGCCGSRAGARGLGAALRVLPRALPVPGASSSQPGPPTTSTTDVLEEGQESSHIRVHLTHSPRGLSYNLPFCPGAALASPRLGGKWSSRCTRTSGKGKSVPSTLLTDISFETRPLWLSCSIRYSCGTEYLLLKHLQTYDIYY